MSTRPPAGADDEDLRDDTLRRALAQAPDRAQLPDWRVRQAILEHARDAVAALEELQAASREPTPWWRLAWWRDKVGGPFGGGMPWNAALATLVVAVLVTLMWQREPVPGAKLDEMPASPPSMAPAEDARRGSAAAGAVQEAESKKLERGEPAREAAPAAPAPSAAPSGGPRAAAPSPPTVAPALPPAAPPPPPPPPLASESPSARTPPAAAPATSPRQPPSPAADAAPASAAPATPAARAAPPESKASPAARDAAAPVGANRPLAAPAAGPEADAAFAARDRADRRAEAPATGAPAAAGAAAPPAPAPLPPADALSRQRIAGAAAPAPAPVAPAADANEAAQAPAARGKAAAAAGGVRTDATPLPDFKSLGQWTQLRLATLAGEVRIVPRAEAGELSQLLSSAAIMAVGAQPMRALPEWRVSLERRGDVLAVLEVGRNQVRWTEGLLPPATGTPPPEALEALRTALRNAMKPSAPGRAVEPAPVPRPPPERAPEAALPTPVAPPASPAVTPLPPTSPAPIPLPPPAAEPAPGPMPLMPPLEAAPPRPANGEPPQPP